MIFSTVGRAPSPSSQDKKLAEAGILLSRLDRTYERTFRSAHCDSVLQDDTSSTQALVVSLHSTFLHWSNVPAPWMRRCEADNQHWVKLRIPDLFTGAALYARSGLATVEHTWQRILQCITVTLERIL